MEKQKQNVPGGRLGVCRERETKNDAQVFSLALETVGQYPHLWKQEQKLSQMKNKKMDFECVDFYYY